MRLMGTQRLIYQGKPQVSHMGARALIIAAHHAVEINRGCQAYKTCNSLDLRQLTGHAADVPGHGGRVFQAASFVHVNNDLYFILVVVGQKFEWHHSKWWQAGGKKKQAKDGP